MAIITMQVENYCQAIYSNGTTRFWVTMDKKFFGEILSQIRVDL